MGLLGNVARFLVDEFAVRELLSHHVDFLDVFKPRGPLAAAQAHDTAQYLGHALKQHQCAGDRDISLNGYTGGPSEVTLECSLMRHDSMPKV